jgi:hypothetical protein
MDAIVYRLSVHARIGMPLVFDDADRYAVLDALQSAFGDRVLAYCLLDERLDVIGEGTETDLRKCMEHALAAYVRQRKGRGAREEPGLPARVEARRVRDARSLAEAINEVHELPLVAGRN